MEATYKFTYYCLDQNIEIDRKIEICLEKKNGLFRFYNELGIGDACLESYDIIIKSIQHKVLGSIKSIKIDLTYEIETIKGNVLGVDSEQNPGMIDFNRGTHFDSKFLEDGEFIVEFEIIKRKT